MKFKNTFIVAILSFVIVSPLFPNGLIEQDSFYIHISDCEGNADICFDLPLDDALDYVITSNGELYQGTLSGCNFDTLIVYTYTTLFGQGQSGPYTLEEWSVDGQAFSGEFENIAGLVDSMNVWDANGNWMLDENSLFITGGVPGTSYSDMKVFAQMNNSLTLIGLNFGLDPNGTVLNFSKGFYELILEDTVNQFLDTAYVTVSCQQNETVNYTLSIDEQDIHCLDFTELMADVFTIQNLCDDASGSSVQFDFMPGNTCVQFTGLATGIESVCIEFCDELGFCDTTYINVTVTSGIVPDSWIYSDTIVESDVTYLVCLDTLEFPGTVDTIFNICEETSGSYVEFNLNPETYCVKFGSLDVCGTDTACVVICDDLGVCDTSYFYITVVEDFPYDAISYSDTLIINFSGTYCLDTTRLDGDIVSMFNACENQSGNDVVFEIDAENYCVNYTAIEYGTENACLILMNDCGTADTTFLEITVIPPEPEIIIDTIFLNTSEVYCLDTFELAGDVISIENTCSDLSGTSVVFSADLESLCITYEGIALGTDTACYVFCDDLGICDTATFLITVIDPDVDAPPVAVVDFDNFCMNIPIVLDILGNDTIPSNVLSDQRVFTKESGGVGPNHGLANINQEGTLTYVSNIDYIGSDSLEYIICNSFGCDTALVILEIKDCDPEEFTIYNGFSPNNDSTNDTFTIRGVEQFPDNTLYIYNRWGNLVYSKQQYKNEWNGTWEDKNLPDGTYFYYFLTGNGRTFTGYLQLQR
ncbi:MAG: gliding motility-associated C-terminal domain-containing protein [Bacteroidetes bacterium]|nr:gliding motility-associated C-terminal domain-containing protein [Bacteroidota bacterium]